MKILILSQFAGSRKHGMVLRNYNWAFEMTRMGHDVTIISSSYAHPRFKQPEVSKKVEVEYIDGIRYIWLKAKLKYNPKNFISRVLSMLSFALKSYITARHHKRKYDVVVASSPHPLVIYAAKKLADVNQSKLVFDIRDLWPLSVKELSNTKNYNPFILLLQNAEDYACAHADLITAVPKNCELYLKSRGLANDKFLHIPNGLISSTGSEEATAFDNKPLEAELKKIRNSCEFIIGYTGSLGKANAMDCLIKAYARLSNQNIHVVIIGKGAHKESLEGLASSLGVDKNIHIFPAIEPQYIRSVLEYFDVLYAGTQKKKLYEYGASLTKINDYMLSKKPILYSVGDKGNPVEISGAGISCEAENIDEISSAMRDIYEMSPEDRIKMGEKGYDWLLNNNMVKGHMQQLFSKLDRAYVTESN